jgi:hypothetical protein
MVCVHSFPASVFQQNRKSPTACRTYPHRKSVEVCPEFLRPSLWCLLWLLLLAASLPSPAASQTPTPTPKTTPAPKATPSPVPTPTPIPEDQKVPLLPGVTWKDVAPQLTLGGLQLGVAVIGGLIALWQFDRTHRQRQEQFDRKELQDQFVDIENRLASTEPTMRANAALRLAEFGKSLRPGRGNGSGSGGTPCQRRTIRTLSRRWPNWRRHCIWRRTRISERR